jgi:hypothetical protein
LSRDSCGQGAMLAGITLPQVKPPAAAVWVAAAIAVLTSAAAIWATSAQSAWISVQEAPPPPSASHSETLRVPE